MTDEQTTALDELTSTEITADDVRQAAEWLSGYANTTAALTAIAAVLRDDYKDGRGANLVLGFALDRFAEHEVTQL